MSFFDMILGFSLGMAVFSTEPLWLTIGIGAVGCFGSIWWVNRNSEKGEEVEKNE